MKNKEHLSVLNGDDHTDLDWMLPQTENIEKSNEMILNAQNLLETI